MDDNLYDRLEREEVLSELVIEEDIEGEYDNSDIIPQKNKIQ